MAFQELPVLKARIKKLKETLNTSVYANDAMLSTLNAFNAELTHVEAYMKPVQMTTTEHMRIHKNSEATLKEVETVLNKYGLPRRVVMTLADIPSDDVDTMAGVLTQMNETISFFEEKRDYRDSVPVLSHASELKRKVVVKIQSAFDKALAKYKEPLHAAILASIVDEVEQSESLYNTYDDLLKTICPIIPKTAIAFLKKVVTHLASADQSAACVASFISVRTQSLDASLKNVGVEQVSKEELDALQSIELQDKIRVWILHLRSAVGVIFVAERQLSDEVFSSLEQERDKVFAGIVSPALSKLISFGTLVAASNSAPEKLFVLLDMIEAIRELEPSMESTFGGQACEPATHQFTVLSTSLCDSVRQTMAEFERAVEKDTQKGSVPGDGSVHPLSSYVLNYIKFMVNYESTLDSILGAPRAPSAPTTSSAVSPSSSPLTRSHTLSAGTAGALSGAGRSLKQVTEGLFAGLMSNLETKSRGYKDPALAQIFLLNNARYVTASIAKSNMVPRILSAEWVERHKKMVDGHLAAFYRLSWGKVISMFGSAPSEAGISKNTVKEKLRAFNSAFEELVERQCAWNMPDADLREVLMSKIEDSLVPAYSGFLKRCEPVFEANGKLGAKYMKFGADDVVVLMQDLYTGRTLPSPK